MAIVPVDSRGRMTFPKKTGIREEEVVLIPAGSFYVVIPVPSKPEKIAAGWLRSAKSRKELKIGAERAALEEAKRRAKRRRQL